MKNNSRKRRALFITTSVPRCYESAQNGFHRRQHLLIDSIRKLVSEIEILLFCDPEIVGGIETSSVKVQSQLEKLWGGYFDITVCPKEIAGNNATSITERYFLPALSIYRQPGYDRVSGNGQLVAFENCLSRKPDFIFVHRLSSMPPVLRSRLKLPPVFLDLDDIEHVRFARSVMQPPFWRSKFLDYLKIPALIKGEWLAINRTVKTLVCSDEDQDKLNKLFLTSKVVAIPNSVTESPSKTALTQNKTILLLGDYRYGPNLIGAEFFIFKVWPRIINAIPDAVLTVAGHRSDLIRGASEPSLGICFPGFLPDLDAAYAATRVVVCPILSGGGTRVKILEAGAYGKPIVSTTIGAEGIRLENNSEILLRDKPQDFADACICLLRDYSKAVEIGNNVSLAIQERYDRNAAISTLSSLILDAVYSG